MLVDHSHDIMTDAGKLRFDFAPVLLDPLHVMLISLRFLLLFDRRENSPRCSPRADHVLVSDREQVPLLDRQFHVQLRDFLHGIDHLCKAKHQKRKKKYTQNLKNPNRNEDRRVKSVERKRERNPNRRSALPALRASRRRRRSRVH